MLRDAVDKAADQALRAGQIIRQLRDFVARGETERAGREPAEAGRGGERAGPGRRQGAAASASSSSSIRRADLVLADEVQIQQVLLNLIRNAIEAMEDGARREMLVDRAPGSRTTAWSRSASPTPGPGIAPEIAPTAVPALRDHQDARAWASACRSPARIVEAHGGKIWVEREPGRRDGLPLHPASIVGKEELGRCR